jgi:hypothetical protein
MRHYHRTHLTPDEVIALADQFFPTIGLATSGAEPRLRIFEGPLGRMMLRFSSEGGHYTRIDIETNQTGESRLDRNVKRFFVQVHRAADPGHALRAAY